MSETGRLERIWIKRVKGGPMDERPSASLVAGRGLAGNADQGGRRQVTLMAVERWTGVVEALGCSLDPAARRANLLVSGLDLAESRHRVLRIGRCRLRVNGETRPCHEMDDACDGLQAALEPAWNGGVFAEALDTGVITVGDTAWWEEDSPPAGR
jgi:MOSC domain-containing protein YiiM